MASNRCLYLFVLLVLFSSCLSKKDIAIAHSNIENDLSVLNGIYQNVAVDSKDLKEKTFLSTYLFKKFNTYGSNPDTYTSNGAIRLKAVSQKKLIVEYIIDDKIVSAKTLKGKIQNNCFVVKGNWKIVGIPPILGFYEESKIALGLSSNGYLNIKKAFHRTGGFILYMNGVTDIDNEYYVKIDGSRKDIYNQTMSLVDSISRNNPNEYILYKTQQHSTDSYVWRSKRDSIYSYRITPNGIQEKVFEVKNMNMFDLDEISSSQIDCLPTEDKVLIGYQKWANDTIAKYTICVDDSYIHDSDNFHQENVFIRNINDDLFHIMREYNVYFKPLHYFF